ncbi:ATP phosphoribosyltransferase [Tumebacillus sp. ITR2]|uniref:ATP phosphoribosyltransferase n=1 Tax=Tumebacillus amylolyticus TaxID=2801339 RepID=A0ABS1J9J7_9BACL|nr:ATP phosphoribosyltransferase [Tumebacillus amylolyticus]MBL0386946.1 ATP phosphoribosyltransferase [Tumebacillus amylolyticus]
MTIQGITVALSKGRIMDSTLKILREAGIPVPEDIESSRKLILNTPNGEIDFILAKPVDVPTYVEYGVADLGIVGKDVLVEADRDLYELLDLGIGKCKMSVAGLPNTEPHTSMPRIASKYPRIATEYFRGRGQQVEVIFLNGSVELAPLIGLAERIVDVVETGRTLKENGLVVQEDILDISTRLVANRSSFRLKSGVIDEFVRLVRGVVEQKEASL